MSNIDFLIEVRSVKDSFRKRLTPSIGDKGHVNIIIVRNKKIIDVLEIKKMEA